MTLEKWCLFGAWLLPGCGGIAVVHVSADASASDGARDAAPDTGLPPCLIQSDCYFGQVCQHGWCCAGDLQQTGRCLCGNGPGCDLTAGCCPDVDASGGRSCMPYCPPDPGATLPPLPPEGDARSP